MGSPIKGGTTNVSTTIRIVDSTTGLPETAVEHNTAGIDLWYRRDVDPGSTPLAKVSITEAALAALTTAHADGGIEHIGDGYYRLDLPDAAVAGGAVGVLVGGTVTDMMVIGNYHPLVDYDPNDAVRLGLTALPNAAADAAGGLAISDAGGLNLDGLATAAALATVDTVVDGIQTDLDNGTDGLGAIKAETALILTDTGTTLQAELDAIQAAVITNAAGADIAADIIAMKAETALIVADTNELQTDDIPTLIAALQTDLDTLTDTSAEPTGVPAASATLLTKVGYLYMALRNQVDVTATKKTFYDDGGVAEWEKDLTDDGTTYSESEGNAI